MQIGGADRKEAARQKKDILRKQGKGSSTADSDSGKETPGQVTEVINHNEVVDMEEDEDFTTTARTSHNKTNQNRTELSCYTAEVIRYGVSDRAAAALYNAAL